MLLALVLAASGVSFFSGPELTQQSKRVLKQHLVDVDDELFVLKQSLSVTGGDEFLKATGDVGPWVALAGVPALLLGLLLKDTSTYRGTGPIIETGVIVAVILLGSAVVGALVYAVGRMISHGFDVVDWNAREKKLSEYRPLVVSAINAI